MMTWRMLYLAVVELASSTCPAVSGLEPGLWVHFDVFCGKKL